MKRILLLLAALALLLGGEGRAKADYIATVTLDTTALTNNPGHGPFAVLFELSDGTSGISDNNNTAKITNFNLHGGSLTSGTISTLGTPSGDLSSTLTIKDSPSEQFIQEFKPGSSTPSSLSFTLDLTTNVGPGEVRRPDAFSFGVLTGSKPNVGYFDASGVIISIDGPNPTVLPGGSNLLPAPVVMPAATAAPEPASLTLLGLGYLGLLAYGRRRRNQAV
jgi:hypothetical protein